MLGCLFLGGASAMCWIPRFLRIFRPDCEARPLAWRPSAKFGSMETDMEDELPDEKKTMQTPLTRQEKPPARAELRIGLRVRLLGLDMKEFNGREGVVLRWDEGHERWWVRLDDGRSKRLRPSNLELVTAAPPIAAPPMALPRHPAELPVNSVDSEHRRHSRMALEHEMRRFQCMQAAQYATAAFGAVQQEQPHLSYQALRA